MQREAVSIGAELAAPELASIRGAAAEPRRVGAGSRSERALALHGSCGEGREQRRFVVVQVALSGYDAIVGCWGVLESARVDNAGKAVSWVPIAGFFVHDEEQRMRIRLKLVVVDVASDNWTMVVPEAADDARTSAFVSRASSDQEQVQALKEKAYRAAATALRRLR